MRTRDARAKRILLLFENSEDTQGTPQAAQVNSTASFTHSVPLAMSQVLWAAASCLCLLSASRMIVCLMWLQELAKVLKRLSGFRTVSVLINSRSLIACGHAAHVSIKRLHMAPAVKLLQERCTMPALLWKADLAQQLAQLCGRNALCLTLVGSFVNAGRCTMEVRIGMAPGPKGGQKQLWL